MPLKYLMTFPDLGYYTYPFPTGRLYIFGNKDSIKMVLFGNGLDHEKDVAACFRESDSGEIKRAVKFLDNYLTGKECPLPELDLLLFTKKEIKVYNKLTKVKFGKTLSYEKLALKAGIQQGARFVGNTMAKNMFPILIPCHRVIKTNGSLGNYSAGQSVKYFLLEHEKAVLKK